MMLCGHLVNAESLSSVKNGKDILRNAKLESACYESTPFFGHTVDSTQSNALLTQSQCWNLEDTLRTESNCKECDPCDWSQKRPHSVGLKGISQFCIVLLTNVYLLNVIIHFMD